MSMVQVTLVLKEQKQNQTKNIFNFLFYWFENIEDQIIHVFYWFENI